MKSFAERNPIRVAIVGVVATAAVTGIALEYNRIPFIDREHSYSAYFGDASGLRLGAPVQVSGLRVGEVSSISLDGDTVQIAFKVNDNVTLGDRTEAAVKTKSLLGAKVLELTPRGSQPLAVPIPLERTTPAYQLPDALGDLATTVGGLNTNALNDSLTTLAQTFQDTPADLKAAVAGVTRFSQVLNDRDNELRRLLEDANKATGVLADRSEEVAGLVKDSNILLSELLNKSGALDNISGHLSSLAKQLSGLVAENRDTLKPMLDKLNGVLTMVDNHKEKLQEAIKLLNQYAMSLGESVASGPFFKAYLANLLPGQFIQPFVDAAFSDLGLDPNVLLPSQLADPPVGQPGTPALPMPYPRTGQGGDPRLTLPDAITGVPGDPRYPYREPPPAPPPGGPPPGPPAPAAPDMASTPEPFPSPVYVPAPGEVPPEPPQENSHGR